MNGSNGERVQLNKPTGDMPAGAQDTHSLSAVNRGAITVRGVRDVLSFDENSVALVTVCGNLTLEGSNLHVTVLNTKDGVVEVTGKLNGLLYFDEMSDTESGGRRSRFGRFFH